MTNPDRRPSACFAEFEKRYSSERISDRRFRSLIEHDAVEVHEAKVDTNHYDEFLFITMSCREDEPKVYYTFFSLGYHEHRERWISGSWGWYKSYQRSGTTDVVDKSDVKRQIADHKAHVERHDRGDEQSSRGMLFEMLAELGDEDGALTELEDLEDLGWIAFSNSPDDEDEDF